MATVEKSIDVDVPIRTAYDQWTQFEDFPKFMKGIQAVEQIDDSHLQWHAQVGGKDESWRAEITSQVPDERVAWRSISGASNEGTVTFAPIDEGHTRVHLRLEYDPQGALEKTGDRLGIVTGRVEGDLQRFKDFIESRQRATGEWRGRIRGGDVEDRG